MKRTSMMISGLLFGISLLFFTLAAEAQTQTITFVSDTTWAVSDPTGYLLGSAQNVCLNASAPSNCPAGATLYGFSAGWTADLSSIPGATWVWAPGIDETSPALPAEFFFSKAFNLPGPPIAGSISVAVDDFAEVYVNGTSAGTTGSVTDHTLAGGAQSSLAIFNVTPFLVPGTNVIVIRAANGDFGCGSGSYSCNPAGVVFGGSLSFQSAIQVSIDIKPGTFPNSINLGSGGTVPVAILSTSTFDATSVDPGTVTLASAPVQLKGKGMPMASTEDVNADGLPDLVVHVSTEALQPSESDMSAVLAGQTLDGTPILGTDSVRVVP